MTSVFVRSSSISRFLLCSFFKQKTAYELRISAWSSDVCSSDLVRRAACRDRDLAARTGRVWRGRLRRVCRHLPAGSAGARRRGDSPGGAGRPITDGSRAFRDSRLARYRVLHLVRLRSEEHTSVLQSLILISYSFFFFIFIFFSFLFFF